MPWMLYRYLMGDLLRVFALTATVLVLVVAFGAAIKPLAGDDLAGPLQTLKYIALATVPMLQFALPFAAGFAATIVLHRMTGDNEILAASASGISYARLLAPIAAMGVVLLIAMILLTHWIIPRFWAAMEQVIARDVTRMVQSSIAKGAPVTVSDFQIYADRLIVQENPPDTGAEQRLILLRVAAAKIGAEGQIVSDYTARQAVVDVHRLEGGDTVLSVVLVDAVAYDGKTVFGTPAVEQQIRLPGVFNDETTFMTHGQLLRTRAVPDHYSHVAEAKAQLADLLRQLDLEAYMRESLDRTGAVELTTAWGTGDKRVVVHADALDQGTLVAFDGRPIIVEDYLDGELEHRFRAGSALIRPGTASQRERPTIDLVLSDFQVIGMGEGTTINDREALSIPELGVDALSGADPAERPVDDLLQLAADHGAPAAARAERLRVIVDELRHEIDARLIKRYALSMTALLLLLLGAILAMWLRHSVPLVIYVWAFLPSILDIITISGGEHMMRDGQLVSGAVITWSGNAILAAVIIAVYLRLSRH